MYNPEYSDLLAFLEERINSNEASDEEIAIYNRGIYGAEFSKGLIDKLTRKMNKVLVS